MDFAAAGDLAQRIEAQKVAAEQFDEQRVTRWIAQIGLALRHAHALRVLHRDLKPQNVFLAADDSVRLGDFGISKVPRWRRDGAERRRP